MKRKALGKGLDALLPKKDSASGLALLDIDRIQPNPLQPRVQFETTRLDELAASIQEKGVIQPIIVRPTETGYEIIAGERRWRAAQRAGLQQVPAILQDVSDSEMLELALIENVQRADLSPIEEAQAYQLMSDQFGLTQEDIATRVGRSRSAVANTLRLLQLPRSIQSLVANNQLTMGHARALLPLPGEHQKPLAREIVQKDLSVRVVEKKVQQLLQPQDTPAKSPSKDPNIQAAERTLERHWKTRVEIRQRGKTGQIVFHFQSPDELDRIYEALLEQ